MSSRTYLALALFALLAGAPAPRSLAQPAPLPEATAPAPAPAAAEPAPAPAPVAVEPAAPAAPAGTPAPAPAAVSAAPDGPAGSATRGRDPAGRETLSVDFPDTDIRDILRNVADLFELNIIMPDTLQGRTTIKLRDVTWRQIFQNVLHPVGFTYVEDENIIKVVSNESLTQEPVDTNVFIINYARASDILPTITTLVDPAAGGRIVVDARSNSLVITERPSRMNRIRPIIEQLDRATDQVMIESKFVEVTDSDVKSLGANWSALSGYQVTAGPFDHVASRTRNSDAEGQPVIGSGTTSNSTTTNGVPVVTDVVTSTLQNLLNITTHAGSARDTTAVFSAPAFNLVLSALQTLQDTKVVSNPTIVTLNNNQAIINVGEERPIPSYTYSQERGTYEVSGFTWKQLGVILRVTPQVNSQGFIKLTVEPEVSQSTRDATFQGAAIPIVETRKASTVVSLKDGYTMGIGGLLRSSERDTSNKVPVLGNVPVLGRLFSQKGRNNEATNLIIFITAKTISAEGAPVEQLFDSERVRQLRMRFEDMPGYRDGSTPFVTDPVAAAAAKIKKD